MQRGPQPGLELAEKVCDLSGLVNGESAPALGGGEGSESDSAGGAPRGPRVEGVGLDPVDQCTL